MVVKISRNFIPHQVSAEYENLSRFHFGCRSDQISSPRPLFVDPQRGILGMSYVDGVPLAHMLHEVRPASSSFIRRAIDLSATALASYHRLFALPEDEPLAIDPTVLEDDLNQCILESRSQLGDCQLRTRVTPFFDFTCWNIMMKTAGADHDRPKLYLIDFPRQKYVFTPHMDLARFRFGLELIKQFPPAKFLGINRWNADSLFDRFLDVYCREAHVSPSCTDLQLISTFKNANIRRSQDLMRKGRCGWQPRLERAYLRTFCRDWLDQRPSFPRKRGFGYTKKA